MHWWESLYASVGVRKSLRKSVKKTHRSAQRGLCCKWSQINSTVSTVGN